MRQIIVIFTLLFPVIYSFGQCDKTVSYFSSKAEFLDTSGKIDRSEEGKIVVKVTSNNITLLHNDDDNDTMQGEITDAICEWKEPYKIGKTTFATRLIEKSGESNDASVSIEGKEGKLVILIDFKNRARILKFIVDRYNEEKK